MCRMLYECMNVCMYVARLCVLVVSCEGDLDNLYAMSQSMHIPIYRRDREK